MWIQVKLRDVKSVWSKKKKKRDIIPSLDTTQPRTWLPSVSEHLHCDIQFTPYQGKWHFVLQLVPWYPSSHAGKKLKVLKKNKSINNIKVIFGHYLLY